MNESFRHIPVTTAGRYGLAVAIVALALALGRLLTTLSGAPSSHGLLLSAVVISAWYGGYRPAIVATILAVLAGSADAGMLQIAIFLAEGLTLSAIVGTLQARLQNAEAAARERDDVLAIAAHEFKTPLTTMIGFTQTLQLRAAREGYLSRRDQDTLRVIAGQARRLHALIDSLLDLARLPNGRMQLGRQRVDLAELARQVVDDANRPSDPYGGAEVLVERREKIMDTGS